MMSIVRRLFRRSRPSVLDDEPEPNFVVMKDGERIEAHVPLAEEVKRVQTDYAQIILRLARANADARKTLARQVLHNVHGKG